MLDLLIENKRSLKEGLDEVVQRLREFTNDVEQFDDITLLAVCRT